MSHLLLFRASLRMSQNKFKNLFVRWHIATHSIEEFDWT